MKSSWLSLNTKIDMTANRMAASLCQESLSFVQLHEGPRFTNADDLLASYITCVVHSP